MILGFYLMMVSIMPSGDVTGEVLDYYTDQTACYTEAQELKEKSVPGYAFTCVEDIVLVGKDA